MNCISCNKKLTGQQKKYCSLKCKNKVINKDAWPRQKRVYIERKKDFIKKFNSKCSKCGYSKNLSALCFHHIDPTLKKLKLDTRSIGTRSMKVLLKEVEKCILLCSNCHAETHNPELNLE
jgi:hypothetical protein